jgi:hypothetical protein
MGCAGGKEDVVPRTELDALACDVERGVAAEQSDPLVLLLVVLR